MEIFDPINLKKLYVPPSDSHKGQNGKLLLIGGSHLFHSASLWALKIASRIVDMVFYSSVPENNKIVYEAKEEFRDGIIVPRKDIENYIEEADCVLIGPGFMRSHEQVVNSKYKVSSIREINEIEDEGEQAYYLTKYLLEKYPEKKWVIDAGALQMMEPEWLKALGGNVIITPHQREFEQLKLKINPLRKLADGGEQLEEQIKIFAKEYNAIVLVKGEEDIMCSQTECVIVKGGNAGMTKGGTGDVLAGLVAALACKNDLWLAANAGAYINKKAGESLFEKVGYYFNASDLVDEIPQVMKAFMLGSY